MVKRNVKRNKHTRRDSTAALGKLLGYLASHNDAFVDTMVVRLVSQMGSILGYKLVMAGATAFLHSLDERAHAAYAELISSYRVLMLLCEGGDKLLGTDAAGIVEGLLAVISSRIRLAEDSGLLDIENPVAAEKNEIVGRALAQLQLEINISKKEFEAAEEELRNRRLLAASFDVETAKACFSEIAEGSGLLGRALYEVYYRNAKACISALNDLERRTVAGACFAALQEEREILRSIVRVQIHALEQKFGLADEAQPIVGKLLERLRSLYQVFMKEADQVLSRLLAAEEAGPPVIAENFESYVQDVRTRLCAPGAFPKQAFEQARAKAARLVKGFEAEFAKALRIFAVARLGHGDSLVYELRKNYAIVCLISEEMENIFRRTHMFYKENEAALGQAPGAEISAGVYETIEIKISSIIEGKAELEQRVTQSLGKTGLAVTGVAEMVCQKLERDVAVEAALFLAQYFDKKQGEAGADKLHATLEAAFERCFRDEADILQRKAEALRKEFDRILGDFLRDVLLYEMCSFEEIINFSVSKLLELPSETPPHKYAVVLVQTLRELIQLLNQNGIACITPKPHEAFDAKRHDVLLAERTDGFAKGQVIKTITSGYLETATNIVLLRATIIAAK